MINSVALDECSCSRAVTLIFCAVFLTSCADTEDAPAPIADRKLTLDNSGFEQQHIASFAFGVTESGFSYVFDQNDGELLLYDKSQTMVYGVTGRDLNRAIAAGMGDRDRPDGVMVVLEEIQAPMSALDLTGYRIGIERPADGVTTLTVNDGVTTRSISIQSDHSVTVSSPTVLGLSGKETIVHWEEIALGDGPIRVSSFVGAFNSVGELVRLGAIPIEQFAAVADSYVGLSEEGEVIYLDGSADILRPTLLALEGTEKRAPAPYEVSFPFPDDQHSFEEVMGVTDIDPGALVVLANNRATVLENAARFLTYEWTLSPRNYGDSSVDGSCTHPTNWRRPRRLSDRVGTQIEGIPYRWGGYASIDEFEQGLGIGALAGDTCTCRTSDRNWCISKLTPEPIGVDCSGFVSRVWGIPRKTTKGLIEFAESIPWVELRPGDALVRPGNHVMIFEKFSPEGFLQFEVIEASKSCGGVCRSVYRPSNMQGYTALKFPGGDGL